MKQIILLLLALISNQLLSQPKEFDRYLIVNASSLTIRAAPSLESEKLTSVKKEECVRVIDRRSADRNLELIDGIRDTWAKVEYKGVIGYMFGGYLSRTSILKPNEKWSKNYVILNEGTEEGSIFYDNLNWYGIYSRKDGEYIEKVKLTFNFIQDYNQYGGLIRQISTNKTDKPNYLIGTHKSIKLGRIGIPIGAFSNQKILNRQCLPIPYYNQEDNINANLCLEAGANDEKIKTCYQEDYQLFLKDRSRSGIRIASLEGVVDKIGDCNIPHLMWFGDINGDFIPDFLFNKSTTQELIHTLCVSKKNNNKITYEIETQYLE